MLRKVGQESRPSPTYGRKGAGGGRPPLSSDHPVPAVPASAPLQSRTSRDGCLWEVRNKRPPAFEDGPGVRPEQLGAWKYYS